MNDVHEIIGQCGAQIIGHRRDQPTQHDAASLHRTTQGDLERVELLALGGGAQDEDADRAIDGPRHDRRRESDDPHEREVVAQGRDPGTLGTN